MVYLSPMISIPNLSHGTIHLFIAGYTGIDFSCIKRVEFIDNLLCVYIRPGYEYNTPNKFFVKRIQDALLFNFPTNGWDYLGKGFSFVNDGKALYNNSTI